MSAESNRPRYDKLWRASQPLAAMAGLVLMLSGCSEDTPRDARAALTAASDRIAFDFLGARYDSSDFEGDAVFGSDCLDDTIYDHLGSGSQSQNGPARLAPAKSTDGKHMAILTPAAFQDSPLRLIGFEDNSRPLQGADEASVAILESYSCPTE